MSLKYSKWAATLALMVGVSMAAWAQDAATQGQPGYKDRAEYDLAQSANTEQDPNKKLGLLQQWQEKYPDSQLKQQRYAMMLATYQALNRAPDMIKTAGLMVADDPKNLLANYWLTILGISPDTSPEALDRAEKAANALMSADKPANVSDADWEKQKRLNERLAHRTLGFVAYSRKDNQKAEDEFAKVLQIEPNDPQVSYWMGVSVQNEKNVARYPIALFHYARAASLTSADWPEASRKQVQATTEAFYAKYHGSKNDLDKLYAAAKASALPPEGFTVVSIADLDKERIAKEEEAAKNNPELVAFKNLKALLTAENGQQQFDSQVKGSQLPKFRGKLVSQSPETRPKQLVIAVEDPTKPDVTLNFETPLPGKADPGTTLEFVGVAQSFNKEPFMITMDAERKNLTGWPAAAAPASKGGARRAAPTGGARRRR